LGGSGLVKADEKSSISPNILIQEADALYLQRADAKASKKAMTLYARAIALDPSQAEYYWKGSRAAWWAGTRVSAKSEKIKLFDQGSDWGKIAVEKNPNTVETHFWLGSNYASFAHTKGAFTSLSLLGRIRKSMNVALKLDDAYLGAGAHRVLGILDYMVPGFVGGDRKKALAHLEAAIRIAPQHPVTYFYLADYYAEGKEYVRAKEELAKLKQLQVPAELEPEWQIIQPEREALEKRLAKRP